MNPAFLFPKNLRLETFGYELPDEKIARYPLPQRDQSKLLIYRDGKISESVYAALPEILPQHGLLVFNNSRVVEARILFRKPSGGQIEIFCLEPHHEYAPVAKGMSATRKVWWACLIGGASKWKRGQVLEWKFGDLRLEARFIEKRSSDFIIEFSWTPEEMNFASVLHHIGQVPLPPYLNREPDNSDTERYQTVYAKESGSVAAPTAGLHFSDSLLFNLRKHNIALLYLTLHVSAGTFMPVKTEKIEEHRMHEEWVEAGAAEIAALIEKLDVPVIAVGTTSLRTLETLYWLGLQRMKNKQHGITQEEPGMFELLLEQEFPYEMVDCPPAKQVLQDLLEWVSSLPEKKLIARTRLFIVPGYRFQIVRGLITNFHQPHSTLLMLVAALIGPGWKSVYTWALEHDYRFLSYGDGCLFLPGQGNFKGERGSLA